jgi:hypothetical protein
MWLACSHLPKSMRAPVDGCNTMAARSHHCFKHARGMSGILLLLSTSFLASMAGMTLLRISPWPATDATLTFTQRISSTIFIAADPLESEFRHTGSQLAQRSHMERKGVRRQ